MPAQILIVDDSPFMRNYLRSCIEQNTDWYICGEAENGEIAIEKARNLHPDLIILDMAMPIMNGLEAARRISFFAPTILLVLFTMHDARMLWKEASAAVIKDVLSKSETNYEQLLLSMRTLLENAGVH